MSVDDKRLLLADLTAACDRWRLSAADRAALLGVPSAALDRWRAGDDLAALPSTVAGRAADVVGLDSTLPYVPDAEPDVAAFLRRPGTAPDGVGTALGAMYTDPAGLAAVRAHIIALGTPSILAAVRAATAAGWDDTHDDPIVAEVRAIREALFAEAGYDLEEFGRQIRASAASEQRCETVRYDATRERPSAV